MEISIIVPVYNVERYLSRCIDSILAQTFPDYELILVDDGSPDSCGAICDQYAKKDNRIQVIHQQNGGAASARNAGLDIAEGEWIAFIDSDDWIHPDYLRILFEVAGQKNADIVACRYALIHDNAIVDDSQMFPVFSAEDREEYWIHDRVGAVVPWGKLYRRELFAELRFPNGRTAEDEYVSYKVLFGCKNLVVLDNRMYRYFVNVNSVSRNNYIQRLPDVLEAFKLHEEYFKNSPWQKVYRLEIEHFASAWSDAIWITKNMKDSASRQQTKEYRTKLRQFLATHKAMIPIEKRKDIYISAYPGHAWCIRGFGILKRIFKHE